MLKIRIDLIKDGERIPRVYEIFVRNDKSTFEKEIEPVKLRAAYLMGKEKAQKAQILYFCGEWLIHWEVKENEFH
jgi:hypothetical protein